MSDWLSVAPDLLLAAAIVLVPGLAVTYASGLRGVGSWGVAPAVGTTVLAVGAVAAGLLGLAWSPALLVVATALTAVAAYVLGLFLGANRIGDRVSRGNRPGTDPRRTRWFALTGILVGAAAVLAAAVPAIHTPGELVDSTDVMAHLNRIRRFVDTGLFSSLGTADQPAYPSGFHDVAGTLVQMVPSLAIGRGLVTAANLAALAAAAILWPVGVVGLARLTLGRSGVVLVGAGLVSAGFTVFPYMLMGWGVLWPNLLGTALLPGVLGPALVAAGLVAPVPGMSRRLAVVATVAAVPGLTLAHPNALVSLVLFVVLAAGTRLALQWRLLGGDAGDRAGVRLAILTLALVLLLLALPRLSRQVADTASYTWGANERLGPSLVDSALLGLQVGPLPWGLLALMAVGAVVCARRQRLRWILVSWGACVLLYVVAATGRPAWGPLLTGYWYNDKVRLAALVAVPASLLAVAGIHGVARSLSRLLAGFSPEPSARSRRPWALGLTAGAGALLLATAVTGVAAHDQAYGVVDRYYHPDRPQQVLLTPTEETELAQLAARIPTGVVTADDPANGSGFLYALQSRPVMFESLLLDPDPDHALIGAHLREAARRTDVCDALRRGNVQYAVTGPVRYWLSLGDRTRGLADLAGVTGFEEVASAGRYRLYRIQACGFDPAWLPPSAA